MIAPQVGVLSLSMVALASAARPAVEVIDCEHMYPDQRRASCPAATEDPRQAKLPAEAKRLARLAADFFLTDGWDGLMGGKVHPPMYISSNFPIRFRRNFLPFKAKRDLVRVSARRRCAVDYIDFDLYGYRSDGGAVMEVTVGRTTDKAVLNGTPLGHYAIHEDIIATCYVREEAGRIRIYRMGTAIID